MASNDIKAVRAVAALEAAKGVLVLLVASGLLSLVNGDLHAAAVTLVEHAHLNPAAHYPKIFVDAVGSLNDRHLTWLALGALGYSTIRFVESWGLFYGMAWAELLGAVSGSIYIPFELLQMVREPSWDTAFVLAVNCLIVAIMVWALMNRRAARESRLDKLD